MQYSIPCVVYRGGTSRGLFFHRKDLPASVEQQKEIFMTGIDAFNPSQVDGLGGGNSHTSKVVVISPSSKKNIDIEYTFYQIGIGEQVVDDSGTCGNLMAAVGAFAVDEKLVELNSLTDFVIVTVYNTNVNLILEIKVPTIKGKAKVSGNFTLSGIVKSSSKYIVNILNPGGSNLGKTLPLQNNTTIYCDSEPYSISVVDVVNPFIYVSSTSFQLNGTESLQKLQNNKKVLNQLNEIRNELAYLLGYANSKESAKKLSPSVPKIAIVAPPQDYVTTSGKLIKKDDVDIISQMVSMGRFHRTYAGSGLYNLAAASLLQGTIPNKFNKNSSLDHCKKTIRIGHPDGIAEIIVKMSKDGRDVKSVGMARSARKIMSGQLFIPK